MKTAQDIGFPAYGEFRPTPFDCHIGLDEREHWAVAPVGRNRDSGCLDNSNFDQFIEGLGGESDTVEIHRFGHWGHGWFEIVIFDPGDKTTAQAAYDMADALADYPVLNEDDLSRREYEEFQEAWEAFARSDFQSAIEHDLESLDCPRAAAFVADLDSDKVDEIWEALRDRLPVEYESHSDGCYINVDDAVELLTRSNYVEIVRRYR